MKQMQTTIIVNKDTRNQLKTLGHKGETYNTIVSRLIELAEQHQFYQEQAKILKTERFVPIEKI